MIGIILALIDTFLVLGLIIVIGLQWWAMDILRRRIIYEQQLRIDTAKIFTRKLVEAQATLERYDDVLLASGGMGVSVH